MPTDPHAPTARMEREDIIQRQLDKLIEVVSAGQTRSDQNHAQTKVTLERMAGEVHDHGLRMDRLEREQNRLRDTGKHHEILISRIRGSGAINKVKLGEANQHLEDSFNAMADHVTKVSEDNARQTTALESQAKLIDDLTLSMAKMAKAYDGINSGVKKMAELAENKTAFAYLMIAVVLGSFLFSLVKWALHL